MFYKIISVSILICLILLAFAKGDSPAQVDVYSIDTLDIRNKAVIQLAPNRIAVVEGRTILVFDYDSDNKTFNYEASFNYSDYFSNPQNYGITLVD